MIREKSQRQTVWKMVLDPAIGEQDIVEAREGKSRQRAMRAQKGRKFVSFAPRKWRLRNPREVLSHLDLRG